MIERPPKMRSVVLTSIGSSAPRRRRSADRAERGRPAAATWMRRWRRWPRSRSLRPVPAAPSRDRLPRCRCSGARPAFRPARPCRCRVRSPRPVTQLVGVLQPEMAEAADALDRDQCVGSGVQPAQRVVSGDAGAQQRSGIHRTSGVRDADQPAARGRIPPRRIRRPPRARLRLVFAVDEVSATAPVAHAAVPAEEADADAVADFPPGTPSPTASMTPTTSCPGTTGWLGSGAIPRRR